MSRTVVAVASGESSSTKTTSQPVAPRVAPRRRSNSRTVALSLKVGMTIDKRNDDEFMIAVVLTSVEYDCGTLLQERLIRSRLAMVCEYCCRLKFSVNQRVRVS